MSACRTSAVRATVVWIGLLAGCGPDGPTAHPVSGRVELAAGDVGQLAGSVVEASSVADPTVRASGEIQPDGSFRLESLHAGVVRTGVLEGRYRVRIVPNNEDGPTRKRAARAVAPRFQKFEASGLTLTVPADAAVTLAVAAR